MVHNPSLKQTLAKKRGMMSGDGGDWQLGNPSLCCYEVSGSLLTLMAKNPVTAVLLMWSDAVTCLAARSKLCVSSSFCMLTR